jgi:hypothetical protein
MLLYTGVAHATPREHDSDDRQKMPQYYDYRKTRFYPIDPVALEAINDQVHRDQANGSSKKNPPVVSQTQQ